MTMPSLEFLQHFFVALLAIAGVGMFAAAWFELGRRHEQNRQERELFRRAQERRARHQMETEHEDA